MYLPPFSIENSLECVSVWMCVCVCVRDSSSHRIGHMASATGLVVTLEVRDTLYINYRQCRDMAKQQVTLVRDRNHLPWGK